MYVLRTNVSIAIIDMVTAKNVIKGNETLTKVSKKHSSKTSRTITRENFSYH